MTDEDTKKRKSPGAKAESSAPKAAPAAAERRPHGPSFLTFVLILTVAAAGYYWVTVIHAPNMNALESGIAAISTLSERLDSRLSDVETRSGELAGVRQALIHDIEAIRNAEEILEASVKALYAQDTQSPLTWVLAEAEYLILAATQRLALERDVNTALAALKAADHRLRSAEHPDVISIRRQLAKDIAALESVNLPDVQGLAIYLTEMVGQVDDFPTKPITEIDATFSNMQGEPATAQNWRDIAQALWADILNLVEIKDGELPDGVLFDPELRYFLQQNLRLELASARLSVLRHDNANFRAASTLIIALLNQYYDTEDAAVAAIITRLNDEQATDLDPTVPGISASLDAIRAKRLSSRTTDAAGVAQRD